MRLFVCLFIVSVLALPATARAQAGSAGTKGGLVSTTISTSGAGSFETDAGMGGVIGVFAAIELGGSARLQPELLITQRRFSAPGLGFSVKARAIDVPLLLHLRFAPNRRVRPILFAGPQLSFISKVTQTTPAGAVDISDDIKNVDAGLTVGGGLEASAGPGAFVVDARVGFGFQDLSETGPPSIKSRAFMLLVGYRF